MDKDIIKHKIRSQVFDLKQDLKNKEAVLESYNQDKIFQYKGFYVEEVVNGWRFSINEQFDKFNYTVHKDRHKTIEKAFLRVISYIISEIERTTKTRNELKIG